MILRTVNSAGTFIYPRLKSGQDWEHEKLAVFVPDGILPGGDWVCTIENEGNGSVVLNTLEDLARMITALEIAFEKAKAAGL